MISAFIDTTAKLIFRGRFNRPCVLQNQGAATVYVMYDGEADPTASTGIPIESGQSVKIPKIFRQVKAITSSGAATVILHGVTPGDYVATGNTIVEDWVERVNANGGTPLVRELVAMETFFNTISSFSDSFFRVNLFMGANQQAALVPQIIRKGNVLDSFQTAAVSTFKPRLGFAGVASSPIPEIATGFVPTELEDANSFFGAIGFLDSGGGTVLNTSSLRTANSGTVRLLLSKATVRSTALSGIMWDSANTISAAVSAVQRGLICINRLSAASFEVYDETGAQQGTSATAPGTAPTDDVYVFNQNDASEVCTGYILGNGISAANISILDTAWDTMMAAVGR